jgi:WD40 repeat protein
MRIVLVTIWIFILTAVSAQNVELAVQKGHTDAIQLVHYSESGKQLVSYGNDQRIIIWDVQLGKELKSIQWKGSPVQYIGFAENDDYIYIRTSRATWLYDISKSEYNDFRMVKPFFKDKKKYVSSDKKYEVSIKKAKLFKRYYGQRKKVFKKTPDYFDQQFTSVDVSEKHNLIIAGNIDGNVYLFDYRNGSKVSDGNKNNIRSLKGHMSDVNDVNFSPDEDYFATASKDRSIIIWNTKTLKPEKRLTAHSFRNYSLDFNRKGDKLAFGNEFGEIKIMDIASTRLPIETYHIHEHPVTFLEFMKNDEKLISAAFDNKSFILDLENQKAIKKLKYKRGISPNRLVNGLFEDVFKYYREPYSRLNAYDINENESLIIMAGEVKGQLFSLLRVYDLKKHRTFQLVKHQEPITELKFINDSTFISLDADKKIHFWLINGKKVFQRELNTSNAIIGIDKLDEDHLILFSKSKTIIFNYKSERTIDSVSIGAVAFAINNQTKRLLVADGNNDIHLYNLANNQLEKTRTYSGHSSLITAIDFHPKRMIFASTGFDATVRIWDIETGKLLTSVIPIGKTDRIAITDDNYYMISKNSLNSVGFKVNKEFYLAEQFDIQYNRPDIVMQRLGFVDNKTIALFKKAYQKRLRLLNFDGKTFDKNFNIPEIELKNKTELGFISNKKNIELKITAHDQNYNLNRVNVYINDVPVFGMKGVMVNSNMIDTTLTVKLSKGNNKVQISAINENGAESLKETFEIFYSADEKTSKPDLYIVALSVSNYLDSRMNLGYAVKDGQDLINHFVQDKNRYSTIYVDTLFNSSATKDNAIKVRKKLLNSKVDDQVIFFVSGHGLLDENFDFYFGTYDVDFDYPQYMGLSYESLEGLIDSIPARKKLLMMDACHSGQIDKDEIIEVQNTEVMLAEGRKSGLKTYAYHGDGEQQSLNQALELMEELFANLNRGSGAVVISAAAGNGYALESEEWNNGVFTYAVLNGMKNKKADKDKDGTITVSELKNYVSEEVKRITKGAQRPTSRQENLEVDFEVW